MEMKIGSFIVLIDADEWENVSRFHWHHNSSKIGGPYFRGWVKNIDGTRTHVYLHRFIINAPKEKHVDHINGNTLDNRKINLRLCFQIENCHNSKKSKKNTTGYKGVTYNKREKKYKAQICLNWEHKCLGTFETAEEAYAAYCRAACEYYGQFARLF